MRTALAALILCFSLPSFAREPQLRLEPVSRRSMTGIGFTLGEPFGLTLKHWMGGANAWDAHLAFAYGPGFRVGADYLWGLGRLERQARFDLDAYIGAGPVFGVLNGPCGPGFLNDRCNGDAYIGARMPIGLEMLLKQAPFSLGVEVAPGFGIAAGRGGLLLDLVLVLRFLF